MFSDGDVTDIFRVIPRISLGSCGSVLCVCATGRSIEKMFSSMHPMRCSDLLLEFVLVVVTLLNVFAQRA